MDVDYDLEFQSEEEESKIRVWGLPFIRPSDPVPLAIWGGIALGCMINGVRKRPLFSSNS